MTRRNTAPTSSVEGSCNYAFTLILAQPDPALRARLEQRLREARVEFRRGTSGGGNQLRQPYIRKLLGDRTSRTIPKVDHVHFYGYYIGNYPELERSKILALVRLAQSARVTPVPRPANEPTTRRSVCQP